MRAIQHCPFLPGSLPTFTCPWRDFCWIFSPKTTDRPIKPFVPAPEHLATDHFTLDLSLIVPGRFVDHFQVELAVIEAWK
jgi:hypothetical protein